MKQDSFHIAYAQLLREGVPKELEEFHRGEADLGQTSMWLVGLASTLLVFAVANPERMHAVLGGRYHATTALLMITITGGVMYRISRVWVSRRVSYLMRRFWGYVLGHTAFAGLELPLELSDGWDEAEIVRRLKTHFEIDYKFLLDYKVPLAGCQDGYRSQYDIWKRYEDIGLERLKKAMAAHFGLTTKELRKMFEPTSDAELAKIKRRAFVARGVWFLGSLLFSASALTFLLAMFYVARGLWSAP